MASQLPTWMTGNWFRRMRAKLLAWYSHAARELPWRNTSDPYPIWLSEIMLQQTQVATVIPYFARFLQAFPTVGDLAKAKEVDVLRYWEGLGYYRRAKQLHAAAQAIVANHQGDFPRDFDAVHELPGIGRYTAGAICSFAFNQATPIVEANTQRLYARLLGLEQPLGEKSSQLLLWEFAEKSLDLQQSGRINQALMELGALICKPKPTCEDCPLKSLCVTYERGLQHAIPAPKAPKNYEDRQEVVVLLRDSRRRWLLRRCQEKERWAGLWDFPRFDVSDCPDRTAWKSSIALQCRERFGRSCHLGDRWFTMQHAVTRYRITLHCHFATWQVGGRVPTKAGELEWVETHALSQFPLSSSGRKIVRKIALPS